MTFDLIIFTSILIRKISALFTLFLIISHPFLFYLLLLALFLNFASKYSLQSIYSCLCPDHHIALGVGNICHGLCYNLANLSSFGFLLFFLFFYCWTLLIELHIFDFKAKPIIPRIVCTDVFWFFGWGRPSSVMIGL